MRIVVNETTLHNAGNIGAGSSYLMLYYDTIQVEHSQQKPLYDGTSFTAAVGGAMGLFLGFSFLDFGRKFIQWLVHIVDRKEEKDSKQSGTF